MNNPTNFIDPTGHSAEAIKGQIWGLSTQLADKHRFIKFCKSRLYSGDLVQESINRYRKNIQDCRARISEINSELYSLRVELAEVRKKEAAAEASSSGGSGSGGGATGQVGTVHTEMNSITICKPPPYIISDTFVSAQITANGFVKFGKAGSHSTNYTYTSTNATDGSMTQGVGHNKGDWSTETATHYSDGVETSVSAAAKYSHENTVATGRVKFQNDGWKIIGGYSVTTTLSDGYSMTTTVNLNTSVKDLAIATAGAAVIAVTAVFAPAIAAGGGASILGGFLTQPIAQ